MNLNLKVWLWISIICMVIYVGIIFGWKPVWGIDFLGGSLMEIKSSTLTADTIRHDVEQSLQLTPTVQTTTNGTWLIRTIPLSPDKHTTVLKALQQTDSHLEELSFQSVGPTIGQELRHKAWIAISLSIVITILYLAYEFRRSAGLVSSWTYGVAAAIALLHDLLFVLALFVILGHTANVALDTLFVTAMLALAGYSVNDTIVLFNRLQQEWLHTRSHDLQALINRAINLTLLRSLNTSLTIIIVLVALLLFGGATIHWFITALLAGTIVGAYSSIFVAPAWLYLLASRRRGR